MLLSNIFHCSGNDEVQRGADRTFQGITAEDIVDSPCDVNVS